MTICIPKRNIGDTWAFLSATISGLPHSHPFLRSPNVLTESKSLLPPPKYAPCGFQDYASQTNIQMIQTQLMANSVDVFFAPEDFFKSLGEFEYLADLNDYLPADVLKKYKDDLVYIKGLDSGKTYPVGIRLKNNKWIKKTGWYKDEVVVGIADNAKDGDLATALVLEILGENK